MKKGFNYIPDTDKGVWARAVRNGGAKKPPKYGPHPMQSRWIEYISNEGMPFRGPIRDRYRVISV